jgi:hypothetical protein
VLVGFEPQKLQDKQNKICIKNIFLVDFFFQLYYDCKDLVMLSTNVFIIFYLTLCVVSLQLIDESVHIFIKFDVFTTRRNSLVFKAGLFFPLLVGRFYNFQLTQNREKQEMTLYGIAIYRNTLLQYRDTPIIQHCFGFCSKKFPP